ncbi:MAG: His/Gly/Thr/Pro-type tRNA ligase C-terminal domain-containing protein [Candidatus Paceibacterota bacterium]
MPIRIEIGNDEVKDKIIKVVRRDTFDKQNIQIDGCEANIKEMLNDIQNELFAKSEKLKLAKTKNADNYKDFKKLIDDENFVRAYFCENKECEAKIKTETKATTRCLEFDQMNDDGVDGKCIYCGEKAKHK